MAEWNMREVVRLLKDSEGKPNGSCYLCGTSTRVWVWRFAANVWIQYQFQDERVGLFRRRARHILVTRISEGPLS